MRKNIIAALGLVALGACGGIPETAESPRSDRPTPPAADLWLFAQAPATEMGCPGDAQFASGQHTLVLLRIERKPVEIAPPPSPEPSIQVSVLAKEASVTETVEAEIFVKDARPEHTYRLVLTPEHPSVRLVGPSQFLVTGQQKVRVRFTSLADGTAPVRVTGFLLNGADHGQHPILETSK
jgi:hypothetical protein